MKVAKIEYAGEQDVFNMEVEGIHSFVVNHGFVAHNCFDESKYFFMMCPMATIEHNKPKTRKRSPFEKWV